MMLADLLRRDQIEDRMTADSKDRLRDFTRQEREVFAALALADFDARTVPGLVSSLKMGRAEVESVLQRATGLKPNKRCTAWCAFATTGKTASLPTPLPPGRCPAGRISVQLSPG